MSRLPSPRLQTPEHTPSPLTMQTVLLLLALVAAAAANPLKFPGSVAELSSRCSQHTVCIGNRVATLIGNLTR